MPSRPTFDPAAIAAAARGFAQLLASERGLDTIGRIEVILCGRGPIERLFAAEAALLDAWPKALRRPPHDLVSSTGEMGPTAALTLRAYGLDGMEVLRRAYDLAGAKHRVVVDVSDG